MVKTEIDSFLQELCGWYLLFCFTFLLLNQGPHSYITQGSHILLTSEEQLYFLFMAIKMTTLEIIIGLPLNPIFLF